MVFGLVISLREIELSGIGPVALTPVIPDLNSLWIGFTMLVLPQIGLTFGNAIVATEATARILYGERAKKVNLKSIPLSMGLANILSGIVGGAPMCHGCGGLTAHCKFGATSERSSYIIGFTLIGLAILFGHSGLSRISAFPKSILGVLLFYVGVQHSLFIKDILKERTSLMIALITAFLGFLSNNLTIGFLTGIILYNLLRVLSKIYQES